MHLLLIDDNEDDLILLSDALSRCQMRVQTATAQCGEDALAYLHGEGAQVGAPRPDLVLLDINMPRMNGFDVLEAIRKHPQTCQLPVIMFTTSDNPGDIQRAYAAGANSYLCKPLERKELNQILAQFLAYWFGTVKLPGRATKAS